MPTLKRRAQSWRMNIVGTYLDFKLSAVRLFEPFRKKSQFLCICFTSKEDSVYLFGDFG